MKLIDVYPDEVPSQPEMGGYQLAVAMDIFRGRYRESFEHAEADRVRTRRCAYRFVLPTANHVFLPGHRVMVQIQSSWFPLYDRNPQTFVPEHLLRQAGGLREGDAARLPGRADGQLHRAAGGSGGYVEGVRAIRAAVTNSTTAMPTISVPRAMKPTPSHQTTPMLPATMAR